jgi:hypothetical protein
MTEWQPLIQLCEKHDASPEFVAECIYAYIAEHGDGSDATFLTELARLLGGDRDEI